MEAFVKEAPEEMLRLEHWGCPWSREPDGHVAVRPFGGMKVQRTWFAADKTGFHMLHTLFQTTLKYDGIRRFDESFVTRLLVDEGRCQGVLAIELATGQVPPNGQGGQPLHRGGEIFPFPPPHQTRRHALAYRAGRRSRTWIRPVHPRAPLHRIPHRGRRSEGACS